MRAAALVRGRSYDAGKFTYLTEFTMLRQVHRKIHHIHLGRKLVMMRWHHSGFHVFDGTPPRFNLP